MKLPSTEQFLLIAGIVLVVMIVGWTAFFYYRSNREGFQNPTAAANIDKIVKVIQNSPVDKDKMCPMLEVQFNTMNQQYLVHQKNGNTVKIEKFNEMLNNLKAAHEMYGCNDTAST